MQCALGAPTIATSLGDPGLEVWTGIRLGRICFDQGNHRAAIEGMRGVAAALADVPLDERFGRGSLIPSFA